jgi:predicted kinase
MKKENLKILILIGIPASGKSTWSKEFIRNNPSWVRINRDEYRYMLKDSQMCEPKVETLISELVNSAIDKSLSKKLNVIVDATNVRLKYIKEFIERYKYRADIDYRVFDISLDKAIERDKNRQMKVGEDVIIKMYQNYKILIDSFDFQPIKKIEHAPHLIPNFSSDKESAIIFDIDGTLALMGRRNPYDWNEVYKDDLNQIVYEQIEFHKSKNRKIIILTGRDSSCRKETIDWLNFYNVYYDALFMRNENDFRKDSIIKREIFENNIEPHYNVLAVYDDRLQVLDMWYEKGIFSFNVNQGNLEF